MSETGGHVLKGDDGSVYFIRDDILEACKLEGEYLEGALPLLDGGEAEVEGFAFRRSASTMNFSSVGQFQVPQGQFLAEQTQIKPLDLSKYGSGTVMCPW